MRSIVAAYSIPNEASYVKFTRAKIGINTDFVSVPESLKLSELKLVTILSTMSPTLRELDSSDFIVSR